MGVAINVLADYFSLLETRFLLAYHRRVQSAVVKLLVLCADLAFSAGIIWLVISLFLVSPLHQGDAESFAEVLGVFSIYSVFFYSTFFTSIWTWAFLISNTIMRISSRIRLDYFLDIENKPIRILAYVVALVTFLGALVVSVPLQRSSEGLTLVDHALCSVFKGRVCLDVARLTDHERSQLDLILLACSGGLTGECLRRGEETYDLEPEKTEELWRVACDNGDTRGCAGLGYLYENGLAVEQNFAEAARLYQLDCENSDQWRSCTALGALFQFGEGVPEDLSEAVRLYVRACEDGDFRGCTNLGAMYLNGDGVEDNPIEAAILFRRGCDGGNALGCRNLGVLYRQGIGVDQNVAKAASLYEQACDLGEAGACTNLGSLFLKGLGVPENASEAASLFRLGCDGGIAVGCTNLGILFQNGLGVAVDMRQAAEFYGLGCEFGDSLGCANFQSLTGVSPKRSFEFSLP